MGVSAIVIQTTPVYPIFWPRKAICGVSGEECYAGQQKQEFAAPGGWRNFLCPCCGKRRLARYVRPLETHGRIATTTSADRHDQSYALGQDLSLDRDGELSDAGLQWLRDLDVPPATLLGRGRERSNIAADRTAYQPKPSARRM